MTASVESWLENISSPPPTAADLAAHVAHDEGVSRFAGEATRSALLRLARIALALDEFLRESREQTLSWIKASRDTANTVLIAIERLQAQQPVVDAALAWRRAFDADGAGALLRAAEQLRAVADQLLAQRAMS